MSYIQHGLQFSLDELYDCFFISIRKSLCFFLPSRFITRFYPFFSHIVNFTVLLAVLSKPAMNEIFLVLVSYVIIFTFLTIETCIFFAASNRYDNDFLPDVLFIYFVHGNWECISTAHIINFLSSICKR